MATWLLNEVSHDPAGNDSLFTAAGPDAPHQPAAAPKSGPPVNGPEEAAQPRQQRRSTVETGAGRYRLVRHPGHRSTAPNSRPMLQPNFRPSRSASCAGTTTNPLFPKLREAWTAFQAADYMRARDAVPRSPRHRCEQRGRAARSWRTRRPRRPHRRSPGDVPGCPPGLSRGTPPQPARSQHTAGGRDRPARRERAQEPAARAARRRQPALRPRPEVRGPGPLARCADRVLRCRK